MREDLEQELMERFEFMEELKIYSGGRTGNPKYCECGNGWYKLIYDMCEELEDLYCIIGMESSDLEITQIKQKNGVLKVYTGNAVVGVKALVKKYERISSKVCEHCGEIGKLSDTQGYKLTLCDECLGELKTHVKHTQGYNRMGINDFVQLDSYGICGFGFIVDIIEDKAKVYFADTDEEFAPWEIGLIELRKLGEVEIEQSIGIIKKNVDRFVYFIICINDILGLEEYAIKESSYIKTTRENLREVKSDG